nr:hypothetical protein [Micromonospora provocatoris]
MANDLAKLALRAARRGLSVRSGPDDVLADTARDRDGRIIHVTRRRLVEEFGRDAEGNGGRCALAMPSTSPCRMYQVTLRSGTT